MSYAVLALCLGAASACNEGGERPDVEGSGGEPGDGDASASGGAELGGGGMGGAPAAYVRLPFAVDDHYVPYGFMGAAQTGALERDPNDCALRPEGAQGRCHRYDYVVPETGQNWAGLYWLTTYDNWGELPGHQIERGAHRVVFRAASSPPGAPVVFFVGGLGSEDLDGFDAEVTPPLTEELKEWTIELVNVTYESGVLGGFGFSIASEENATIYIDDIRWE